MILTLDDLQVHIKVQALVNNAYTTLVVPSVILGEMANVYHKHVALWKISDVRSALIVLGEVAVRDEGSATAPGSLLAPVLPGMPVDRGGWVEAFDGH